MSFPKHQASREHVDRHTQERGWFLRQIVEIDQVLSGRWPWWLDKLAKRSIGDSPIPQIPWDSDYGLTGGLQEEAGTAHGLRADILKVFTEAQSYGNHRVGDIVDWWLWGLGEKTILKRPELKTAPLLYQRMDLVPRMMAHPRDWAAMALGELMYPKGSCAGWFPTPMCLTTMMAMMSFGDKAGDSRVMTVNDPCVGTGAMLLAASNYSLRLCGNDIDVGMVRVCLLQGYLYVPWMVWSGEGVIREFKEWDESKLNPVGPPPRAKGVTVSVPTRAKRLAPPVISPRNSVGALLDVIA